MSIQPNVGISKNSPSRLYDYELFPSVNNGQFTIENSGDEVMLMTVIDVLGRNLYQRNISGKRTFDDLDLKPGTYYIKLENSEMLGVKKMVVQ
jgi:hypothetical protein